MVGYDQDNFNYLIFDLQTHKLHTSHNVTFNKSRFPFFKTVDPSNPSRNLQGAVKYRLLDDSDDDDDYILKSRVTPLVDNKQDETDPQFTEDDTVENTLTPTNVTVPTDEDTANADKVVKDETSREVSTNE